MSAPFRAAHVSPVDLRRAASRFPTGVALVTAPGPLALVMDSFISVSLEPPLIALSPSRASLTWRRMRSIGRFGVSVLGAHHADGIRERARPGADRLRGLDVELLTGGVPVIRDALAVLLCTLEAEHTAGDHTIAIGRVREIHHGGDEWPLVFHRGEFGTVSMPARPASRRATRPVAHATSRAKASTAYDALCDDPSADQARRGRDRPRGQQRGRTR